MATTKLYLDTRTTRASGTYPLCLKVTLNSKQGFLLNLNTSLSIEQWDGTKGLVISHPLAKEFNLLLKQKQAQVDLFLLKAAIDGQLDTMSALDVKRRISNSSSQASESDFASFFEHCMNQKTRSNTIGTYRQTLKKVQGFDRRKLRFADITFRWLKEFEQHLASQNLSVNTINIHFRNIRAVFKAAINEDVIEQNIYPFNKFKHRTERTKKRALTVEQLRKLRDYPCEEGDVIYVDLFMLMFYLLGINIGDLLLLRPTDYTNGRIEFRRQKTGRLYSIKVEPEASAIINRYKGQKYLLRFMDTCTDYNWFFRRMNKHLKRIGPVDIGKHGAKSRTALFPYLTTYWARHTWATTAAGIDIPRDIIAYALGHGTNTITDIYIDFDQSKVDKASRKVIDHLLGKDTKNSRHS